MATDTPVSPIADLVEKVGALDQDFLRAAATIDPNRLTAYTTAERYYDGDIEHSTRLNDRTKEYLELSGLPYNENFCETVVDALAGRLRITGVTSDDEDFQSYLWSVLWDRNRLDAHQGSIFTETLKKGDAYLIVDWEADGGYPCVRINGPERCKVEFVDGKKWYAAKTWDTSEKSPLNPNGTAIVRMNVYWPERIERYYRLSSDDAGSWAIWVDEGDPSWPIAWVDPATQKPLGIPVFLFANKPGIKKFGRAEHRGTIPQQDRLVKELIDLSLILDTQGWPQRTATGVGNSATLKTNPGEVWSMEGTEGKFDQFEAADPAGPLASIESTLLRIAARSQTPIHLLVPTSSPPSGESQKAAEAGLVAKAKDRQGPLGEEWIGIFRMMASLAAIYASDATEYKPGLSVAQIVDVKLNVQWADPETRNEKEHLDGLVVLAGLGISKRTIFSMIPGIDAEQELEQAAIEAADRAAQMMATMAAGGIGMAPGQGKPIAGGDPSAVNAGTATNPPGTDGVVLPAVAIRSPKA